MPDKFRHKKRRQAFRLSEDSDEKLIKMAQSSGKTKKAILEKFIDLGEKYNFMKPGWESRLNEALDQVDVDRSLANRDGECDGLAYGYDREGKELWRCIHYQEGKPPFIKIIGRTESLKITGCLACGRTEEKVKGFKVRDARIAELETELGQRSTEIFKIPQCNFGARLGHDKEDQLVFDGCRKHTSGPVSVEKFCKVYSGGLPCAMFAQVAHGVGSE